MISLLVPTRGRPINFEHMVDSAFDAAMFPDQIEVIARVDNDDEHADAYWWYGKCYPPRSMYVARARRGTMSAMWNECAEYASGDILMLGADDIRFRTPGWDEHVRFAFEESTIRYVYGRDGISDQRMATHGFLHRDWYEAVGFFTWPDFTSDYADLWNHVIAERLGVLHYLPGLYTEHLHPSAGKSEYDQTHLDRLERDRKDRNMDRWEACQPELEAAVQRLRMVM